MTAVPQILTAPEGPSLSRLVAGCWRMADWPFDVAARLRWIEQTLDLGIDSFDHADIYGDYRVQSLFGEALRAAPGLRERMKLVTKCGIALRSPARPAHRVKHYDTSAAHVEASVETALREFHTDRIDLLLIHRPDALMDADALARCFERLRAAGKVLHVGVSNFTPSQFALLHRRFALATNQLECSPLHLDPLHDGAFDQAQDLGIAPMVWSPLAGGRLFTGTDDAAQRVRAVLARLAGERGVAPATLAYAWLLRHPARLIPITGSQRVEAMRDAVRALELEPLDAQAWHEIWEAGRGQPVP